MCGSINHIINNLKEKDDNLLAQVDAFLSNQLKRIGFMNVPDI